MFTKSIQLGCECIEGPTKGRSQVAAVLEKHATLKREVDDLTFLLNDKEVNISNIMNFRMRSLWIRYQSCK